jgi:hypothetical protein
MWNEREVKGAMYRRRRPPAREVAFSFDSFLDLVANVIGIIIRLILVAWVGARSYSSVIAIAEPEELEEPPAAVRKPDLPRDPLQSQLERTQKALEQARARLFEQIRDLHQVKAKEEHVTGELSAVRTSWQDLDRQRNTLDKSLKDWPAADDISLAELRRRGQDVTEQIRNLEKLPSLKKTLHYHTPVSRPVQTAELMFECQAGRVTFVDVKAMLDGMGLRREEIGRQLQSQYQVAGTVGPIGPFRLNYVWERQATLVGGSGKAYLSWHVEPVTAVRGETAEKALAPGSEFRNVIEGALPEETVATFWVYPDSFALYRRLRDFLYQRGLEVAGRPMPYSSLIGASPLGSASRGQ